MIYKLDGFDGNNTDEYQLVTLWVTEAATAGDWIASDASDTSNPGGYAGGPSGSFRIADADEAQSVYDTVGPIAFTTTAAGYAQVYVRGRATANVDSGAAVAVGDFLSIGSTAGRAIEYTGTNPALRQIGTCLTTPSSNLATVEINPHPMFIAP